MRRLIKPATWVAVLCALLVVLTACPASTSITTDPQWVHRRAPHSQVALVFIHGIFGDTLGTWTNSKGPSFFDLVDKDPDLGPLVDSFAFGYSSKVWGSGSLDIQEAANRLHTYLYHAGVLDYPTIVFVAHSMGGLVVLRELLTHREMLEHVRLVLFYATPQEGSQITTIARKVARNRALEQMLPADRNGYLRQLNDEWKAIEVAKRPPIRCAYETQPTHNLMVVPWSSATRFCDGAGFPVAANHLTIVKPDRSSHDSMVFLSTALKQDVLSKQPALMPETANPQEEKEDEEDGASLAPNQRYRFDLVPPLNWLTSVAWAPGNRALLIIGKAPAASLYLYSASGRLVKSIKSPTQGIRFTRPAFIERVGRRFLLKDGLDHFIWLDERYQIIAEHQIEVHPRDWVVADDHHLAAIGDLNWVNGLYQVPLDMPGEPILSQLFNQDQPVPPIYLLGYPHIAIAGRKVYLLLMDSQQSILPIPRESWLKGTPTPLYFEDFRQTPKFSSSMSGYQIFEGNSHIAGMYGWKDYLYLLLKCKTLARLPTRWFLAKLDPNHQMRALQVLSLPATAPHLTLAPGEEFWAIIERGTARGEGGNVSQEVSRLVLVPTDQIESSASPLISPGLDPKCSDGASWNEGHLAWEPAGSDNAPTLTPRK